MLRRSVNSGVPGRSYFWRAVTPVNAYKFPIDALSGLLMGNAGLQFRFLCKVTHTLLEAQHRALVQTRRDPVERVAAFLAMMEQAQGEKRPGDATITLPMASRHRELPESQ